MSIYHLELLDEIRQRLDDVGGDMGNPPAGYAYRWQYDDTGCLWKNTELVRYLNETIREVGLRKPIYDTDDATICTISIAANTRSYLLNPLILSIEEARLASTGLSLIKSTVKRMREMIGRYRPTENWRTLTGAVTHYLEDEYERQISLYHTPSTSDVLKLSVKRLFKDSISWAAIASESSYSAELLASANWTAGAGWSEAIDDHFAHSSGTATLTHSATITATTHYRAAYTVTGRTSGSFTLAMGGQTVTGITATGSSELTAISASGFTVTPTTDFDGTVVFSLTEATTLTTAFSDIPDFYRKALVFGTVAQAYRKRDADTHNPQAAQEADQILEFEVGPKVPFVQHEQNRLSSNLWRSKSINETMMQRRAQTEEVPQQKAKVGE